MKGIRQLLVLTVIAFASACSSTHNTSSAPDDVYYSKSDAAQSPPPAVGHPSPANRNSENSSSEQTPDYSQSQNNSSSGNSASEQSRDQNGNTIVNNYNYDDYYDYSYSSRLRRYYTPVYGYGYYDPFYTNMYWYDYNPYSYGTSIYLGYHFWAPPAYYYSPFSYGPSVSIGFGWGYGGFGYSPYYSPFYNPWHSPYYGGYGYYGSPYGGYGYANPYYYNSFDGTSAYHYGPRGSVSGTGRSASPSPRSIGEKYQRAVAENRISSLSDGNARNTGINTPVRKSTDGNPVNSQIQSTRTDKGEVVTGGTTPKSSVRNSSAAEINNGAIGEAVKPSKGVISTKNENGGTRPTSEGSPSSGGRIQQVYSNDQPDRNPGQVSPKTPADKGGDIRPGNNNQSLGDQHIPSRNNAQPRNNAVQGLPENSGGTVRPNISNNPVTPRNNDDWRRNQNTTPGNFDVPKKDRNYDRPRQYQQPQVQPQPQAQPRIEPRQEPRQYKQPESPQPRQQPNYTQPERKSNSAPSENRGSGRRK